MADAAAAAVRVDVNPATLVAAGEVIVGVRADRSTAYVVAFTQDGGTVATQVVASASPVALAANHVNLAGGPVDGSVFWGTADPTVERVVVAHEDAVGGRVVDGLWVVVVPGVEDPLPLEWSFVRRDGSVATSGSGAASAPDGPPPLNELEVAVIDALGEMGLEGWQVEHSFGEAAIWVRIDDARQLLVNGYELERDRTPFTATATRRSGGVEVELGEGTSGDPLHRFRCGQVRYYVSGTPPPPFIDLHEVVDAFIAAVGCAAASGSSGDRIVPVSAAHPSEEAEAVFAKCHIGDQIPIEQVAAMGKIPAAADLAHYVPLTGKEPQLLEAGPAWVVEVRAEIPQPASREVWIGPTCVVTASSSGYFATGPVRDVRSGAVMTPAPPQFPPDRTLPPLAP